MTGYPGSCHCGAVTVVFTSDKAPQAMRVGRCACSFCRRHGARTLGDPGGSVEFRAASGSLARYRFALGITDYLVCSRCGTYVGAVMLDQGGLIGIVNVNALDIRDTFDPAPPLHDYDGEDEARRRARRRKFWMKATVIA
ncbi:MAG: aldehyde-activating protein [Alphaproteobacteria bacterium]|nr:aldehyde-activating protein [Alphaproteobacteria bacterium]